MTLTPWGASETLGEPNGRGVRARLFGATVAVVAEKGCAQTTVADIIEVAGVSRATFYKHFADKQACMLGAVDAIAEGVATTMATELAGELPLEQRVQAALDAFVALVVTYPTAARLCLVELWALGAVGAERNEKLVAEIEAPYRMVLEESPEYRSMPPKITRAVVGGVYKTLHGRVRRGEQDEIASLTRDVCAWGLRYGTPPGPIRHPRVARDPELTGPQFAAHGKAGRLFAACVAEVGTRGYTAVTIDGLARRASMSLRTLYSLFSSKEEILLATYDAGAAQANAFALPAFARHDSWPHAVRAAIDALLCFVAGDPAWARMGIVEMLAGGEHAMERSDRVIDSYTAILAPGLERNPGLAPIALEATAGAIYTLVYEQVLSDPRRLPEIVPLCTYVALTPFIGPDEALAVANDGERTGRRLSAPQGQTATASSATSEPSAT